MAKLSVAQNQFNAGEWSPRMYGRSDLGKYSAAVRTATNCHATIHGPMLRRPGTKYAAYCKEHDKQIRLGKFQFAKDDAFILEMGDNYMRFFADSGQVVESAKTITGITAANPAVVTSNAHGYSNGDHVYIEAVVGMTEINNGTIPYIVANKSTNTFEVTDIDGTNVDSSAYTAYSSAGTATKIYEITTPWDEDEVRELTWAQFGDDIYFAHSSYETRILTRVSSTNWTLSTLGAKPTATYEAGDTANTSLTPGATTGNGVTFTASANYFLDSDIGRQILNLSDGETGVAIITALGAASPSATATCDIVEDFTDTNLIGVGDWKLDLSPIADLDITEETASAGQIVTINADEPNTTTTADTFRTGDVGKYIIMSGGVLQITQRTSASAIKAEVLKSLDSTDETGNWTLQEATWSASRGYPRAVGIFQNRLVLGGTTAQPQTVWLSETGIFNGFGPGASDSDAIDLALGSTEVNQISWIASSRDLIVGTAGGELTINGGATGVGLTAANISQQPRTAHGSGRQQVPIIGSEALFLQKSGRKIRTFRFDFDVDTYRGQDLTFLAEHITSGGIQEIAYSQEPDSKIYAVTVNGAMLCGVYDRTQEVMGWSKYETDGTFENIQTISEGEEDQAWVIVKRTVNGTTRRMLEFLDNGDGIDDTDSFSDSAITVSNNKPITGITAANPAVVTATAHGFSDGDTIIIKDLVDPDVSSLDSTATNMTSLNGCVFTVANKTANTYELTNSSGSNIDTSAYNAYGSGGNCWETVSSISGLSHLEGKTVQVKGDGARQPDQVVTNGTLTADVAAGEFTVGLPYTTTLVTLDVKYDSRTGPTQAQQSRWVSPIIRVYSSANPTLNGEFLPSRNTDDAMDKRVPLYSGDLRYGGLGWNASGRLTFTLSDPFPLHITSIFGTIEGSSG